MSQPISTQSRRLVAHSKADNDPHTLPVLPSIANDIWSINSVKSKERWRPPSTTETNEKDLFSLDAVKLRPSTANAHCTRTKTTAVRAIAFTEKLKHDADFHQKQAIIFTSSSSFHSNRQWASKAIQWASIDQNLPTNSTKTWARFPATRPEEAVERPFFS